MFALFYEHSGERVPKVREFATVGEAVAIWEERFPDWVTVRPPGSCEKRYCGVLWHRLQEQDEAALVSPYGVVVCVRSVDLNEIAGPSR